MAATDPTPMRVTYPQLVGYVDRRMDSLRRVVREEHATTAELIVQVRTDLLASVNQLGQRMNEHDVWHRDQLTGELARGPANRAGRAQVLISALSLLVAALAIVWAIVHG